MLLTNVPYPNSLPPGYSSTIEQHEYFMAWRRNGRATWLHFQSHRRTKSRILQSPMGPAAAFLVWLAPFVFAASLKGLLVSSQRKERENMNFPRE